MDSIEFASDFDAAFGVKVISFNVNIEANQSIHSLGNYQAVSYNSPALYTVSLRCYMSAFTISKSPMDHFDVLDPETRLVEVKTTSRADPPMGGVTHIVDLTYQTLNYDRFYHAVKNVTYNRFSEKLHEQLEDILD